MPNAQARAVVQAGDRPGLIPLQDVDKLWQPLVVVDGYAFRCVEAEGRQPQNDMRQVVETVADFFARHVADSCREQATHGAEEGQQVPLMPDRLRAQTAGPGGRNCSLSAASWIAGGG